MKSSGTWKVLKPQNIWEMGAFTWTGILRDNYVTAMGADVLAPCVARSSAANVLTL